MKLVYVEGQDYLTCNMWERHGYGITEDVDEADIVCFTGGADVSPLLYFEKNTTSYCDRDTDLLSTALYSRVSWRNDVLLVGICRGGQFLNVMQGGSMRQHVDGHGEWDGHYLNGPDGPVHVRSDHHQAMVSNKALSPRVYISTDEEEVEEIVVYVEQEVLCFQPHPEYTPAGSDTEDLFFDLVEEFFYVGD